MTHEMTDDIDPGADAPQTPAEARREAAEGAARAQQEKARDVAKIIEAATPLVRNGHGGDGLARCVKIEAILHEADGDLGGVRCGLEHRVSVCPHDDRSFSVDDLGDMATQLQAVLDAARAAPSAVPVDGHLVVRAARDKYGRTVVAAEENGMDDAEGTAMLRHDATEARGDLDTLRALFDHLLDENYAAFDARVRMEGRIDEEDARRLNMIAEELGAPVEQLHVRESEGVDA